MSESSGTTVSTPYIFLVPKNRRDIGTKKALMSSDVSGLLRTACRLFKNYGKVKAIYTEEGELVTSMDQVIPSKTYYVTTVDPDLQNIKNNDKKQTEGAKNKQQESKPTPKAFSKLFGNDTTFNAELRKKQEQQRIAEEQEARRKAEEEERIRQEKIELERRRAEEERKRIEEEKRQKEEARQRKLAEELRRKQEEERRQREEEEKRRQQEEEEERLRKIHEEAEKQKEAERLAAEEEDDEEEDYYYDDYYDEEAPKQEKPKKEEQKQAAQQKKEEDETENEEESIEEKVAQKKVVEKKANADDDEYYSEYYEEEEEEEIKPQKKVQQKQQPKPVKEELSEEEEEKPKKKVEQKSKKTFKTPTKIPVRGTQPTPVQTRKIIEEEDEEEEQKEVPQKKVTIIRDPSNDDSFIFDDDEDSLIDEDLKSAIKNYKETESNDQFIFDDEAPRDNSISTILSDLICTNEMEPKFEQGLDKFKDSAASFITQSPKLELKQENYWGTTLFNTLKKQFTLQFDGIKMKKAIAKNARDIIAKHRTPIESNTCYAMKLGVVGPRHSGKSTFLTVLSHELIADMIASSTWKRTFIFFTNLQIISPLCQTFKSLYTTMIDITIDMLSIQRPKLSQFSATLKKYFNSVLTAKKSYPTFSPSSKIIQDSPEFAAAATKIAQRIWTIYNDEDGMNAFLSIIFMLPKMIANAAGFERMFFILDNFEYGSFNITPSEPFNEAFSVSVNLADYWKFALQGSNFIIACERQDQFFETLQPFTEGGIDLTRSLDFISTVGMIKEDEASDAANDATLNVTIEGFKQPFKLSYRHCGGCYAFVCQWNDLMNEFNEYEDIDSNDDIEKEEKRLEVVAQVQQFMEDLFVSSAPGSNSFDEDEEKNSSILVTNVTRVTKSTQ